MERKEVDPSSFPLHNDSDVQHKQYSVFTTREKWFIVCIIAFAGLHSPLTANIYFPAIPTIASDFHKSVELIDLTVTCYMVLQGISPMFWGTLSDFQGRRPMYLACLLILTVSSIALGLVPTSDYWLLLVLRSIQATGSASTLALGAGVIGDISTTAERAGFFGLFGLGPFAGPTIGPVIGGVLASSLGWRSIFWFLSISASVCLLAIIMFLPETLRSIVGNGSINPPAIYQPLLHIIGRNSLESQLTDKPPKMTLRNPFRLLTYPDLIMLLVIHGITYALFYGITTTLSTLFLHRYPFLSEVEIGLCFLAIGGGMLFGSIMSGKLLDWDYQRIKRHLIKDTENDPEKRIELGEREEDFPIENARLRTVPFYLVALIACCIGYGWCLERKVFLAGPLILQFAIGYVSIAVMNATQTLCVDLFPSQGSSVTACNNLIRCSLGAGLVSVIDLIIDALGPGWTFVLLSGICSLVTPLIYLVIRIGPVCRTKRLSLKVKGIPTV